MEHTPSFVLSFVDRKGSEKLDSFESFSPPPSVVITPNRNSIAVKTITS
jgi:hypothetical protein